MLRVIENFAVQYPGHVDFKDIGYDATPVNSRWLSEDHLNSVYLKAENIAKVMDKNGYSTLWLLSIISNEKGMSAPQT